MDRLLLLYTRSTLKQYTNNNNICVYSNQIINTTHAYRTITNFMDVTKTERNVRHLDKIEKCYIYLTRKDNLHLNCTHIYAIKYSKLYTTHTQNKT
jgi:hypothetical protein